MDDERYSPAEEILTLKQKMARLEDENARWRCHACIGDHAALIERCARAVEMKFALHNPSLVREIATFIRALAKEQP